MADIYWRESFCAEGWYWARLAADYGTREVLTMLYRTREGQWLGAGPWRELQEPLDGRRVLEVLAGPLVRPGTPPLNPAPPSQLEGMLERAEQHFADRYSGVTAIVRLSTGHEVRWQIDRLLFTMGRELGICDMSVRQRAAVAELLPGLARACELQQAEDGSLAQEGCRRVSEFLETARRSP